MYHEVAVMYTPGKSRTQYSMKCWKSLLIKNVSSDQPAAQTDSKAHSLQKPLFSAHISADVKVFHTSKPLLSNEREHSHNCLLRMNSASFTS